MRIGIDLDNTLADYRRPLEKLCVLHDLRGPHADPKLVLRERLRASGQESEWTRLQGELYGPLMDEAEVFVGAKQTIRAFQDSGCEVFIVSHRTKHPIIGQKHDLHESARRWIAGQGLTGLGVFFEETKDAKVAQIAALECDVFIDDLPEILTHPDLPALRRKILFDPGRFHGPMAGVDPAATWLEIRELVG